MIRLDLHTRPFIEQLGPTIPGFIIRVVLKSDVEFVAEGAKWKVHSRTKCHFRVSFEFRAMKKTSADRRPIENSVLAFHPLLKQIFEVNLSQYITNIAST